jgi:predicted transcriptional regulator
MPDVIMSIKSKYAEAIYDGIKIVELRTIVPRQEVEHIWIYETSPKRMITGYFTPVNTSFGRYPVCELVALYTNEQLVGRDVQPQQLFRELGDRAYKVIKVVNPTRIPYPITPTSCGWPGNAWRSPESWRYATEEETHFMELRGYNAK